jgi:hypothetical protein
MIKNSFYLIFLMGAMVASNLKSNEVTLHRTGKQIDVAAPDGESVLSLLPPFNEDSDPTIRVQSKGHTLSLGNMQRSAVASWRPDSSVLIISDRKYSNHFRIRMVRTRPRLLEVTNFDNVIKERVFQKFPVREFIHYWEYAQGWTPDNKLLVVVCADGARDRSSKDTKLLGFSRGYLVDTDHVRIISELDRDEYSKLAGTDSCQ